MLDLASKYETQLQLKFAETWFNEKFKYYHNSCYRDKFTVKDSSWNKHEFVSLHNGEVIGYLAYSIDREIYSASSLGIINFYNDANLTFVKDLHKFLQDIFDKFNFNKINFTVVVGNPIEKSYDRFVQKYGGRIVGFRKNDIRLIDNSLVDLKLYEILREDYLKSKSEVN
jgi:hypothetical protein